MKEFMTKLYCYGHKIQKTKERKTPIVYSSNYSEEEKSDIEGEKRKKPTFVESDGDVIQSS